MVRDKGSATRSTLMGLLAFMAVLLIHGTIPFVMLPTLGQAVWSMGFAESFSHGPWYEIYARHFGLPNPAPIAFGLAGAWPASVLIRMGLHAADAYATVLAIWLAVALFGAYRIGRLLNVTPAIAWLGGVAWLGMPVVWAHADYSMLSLGIALLAFYYWTALNLFVSANGLSRHAVSSGLLYILACTIAVFMDGYTFVMFAFGASLLWLYALLCLRSVRKQLLQVALPIHVFGFAFAYLLYGLYVGKASFTAQPLDFFRGWSLDLTYLVIPTAGLHGLADLMGLGQVRSDAQHFGDSSVWRTTFGLPLLIIGSLAVWRVWQARIARQLGVAFLIIGLLAFYLALGPTLKFDTTKPLQLQHDLPGNLSAAMGAKYGVIPTGNAWIYSNLPAFNVMRATYRWSALGFFAFWLLTMVWLGQKRRSQGRDMRWMVSVLSAMIVINLPTLPEKWRAASANRVMFEHIDTDLVSALTRYVKRDETVVFMPWRNDFLLNYVAPAAKFWVFNVGGDKNLAMAKSDWPWPMAALNQDVTSQDAIAAYQLLVDGVVDVIVLSYVDTLWSAYLWPCPSQASAEVTTSQIRRYSQIEGIHCPSALKDRFAPFLEAIRQLPAIQIDESKWFAAIRLEAATHNTGARDALAQMIADQFAYPMQPSGADRIHDLVLQKGWHGREPNQVWSTDRAHLSLPIPSACMTQLGSVYASARNAQKRQCRARLTLRAFGASEQRPVSIVIATSRAGFEQEVEVVRTTPAPFDVTLPLFGRDRPWQAVTIDVPHAISPKTLNGAADTRELGVALSRIDLIESDQSP